MDERTESEFPLLDYLDELVDELRKRVGPAIRGQDVEAVHEARVATRRLKAATGLLDSVLSGRCRKPFDKITRGLRRQLGSLRDLDVMIGHLDQLKDPKHMPASEWVKNRLIACRQKEVEQGKDHNSPSRVLAKLGTWWGLRQEIVDVREAIDSLLAESIHLQLDAFAEQAEELIATQKAGPNATAKRNDPHQLRIAGKSLRYTLEMAKEHGKPLAGRVMSLFKRMQESLGLWHDYVVLTERMLCETVECDLALHDPELQGQILGLAQITLKKSQGELAKMAEFWLTRGPELSTEIRQAFPLSKIAEPPALETIARPVEAGETASEESGGAALSAREEESAVPASVT